MSVCEGDSKSRVEFTHHDSCSESINAGCVNELQSAASSLTSASVMLIHDPLEASHGGENAAQDNGGVLEIVARARLVGDRHE